MDILLPLMSLVFAFVAGSTSGKSTKHRHSPIKKFLSGKRSDLPWWNIPNTRNLKKARAGRPSQGPSYPFSNQYAAYAPSFPPSAPSFYPAAYPSLPSFSYPPPSSYPAPPPYYYPPSSYPSPASYLSPYPSSLPGSSFPTNTQAEQLSYSTSSSNVYANDQYQQKQISFPSQVNPGKAASMGNSAAYLMISGSTAKPSNEAKKPKAKPTPPDRTEKFEIKGRFFKSIGCWADSTKIRAMDTLEGKSSRLKQPYKTRVNALMKCAEVADEQDLKIFGLQNGGQCFGGKNAENTYRKYGQSTECAGDGEGGPWSNEVYSFLDEDDQPLVKPPKIMDNNNGSRNGTSTACLNSCVNNANKVCPNPCANNSSSSSTNTTCSMPPPSSASAGQICGWGCQVPIPGCNGRVTRIAIASVNKHFHYFAHMRYQPITTDLPSDPFYPQRIVTGTNGTVNGTGAPAKVNQTAPAGCGSMGTVGAIPCNPSPVAGCVSMGLGGGNPCPPQGMPMGNLACGGGAPMGGAPCGSQGITIDSGCIQMGGAPCPAPAQGMAPGGCIDMGAGCVIEGKLTEGYPNITNATAGGNPCQPYGNATGGCGSVIPGGVGPSGPNRTKLSNGTTLGQIGGKPPPSTPKCKAKADLGFIIDGSGSIEKNGPGTFKKVLSFVKDLTRSFDVSKEGTHVGVIVYSDEPKVVSGFDQHYTQSEVIAAIEGIQYPNGGTNTGKALLKAKEALFAASARSGVPNIACVLTDGKSKDNIGAPAQKLRDSGVTVISIGMGTDYDLEQLREIATDPDSQHMFKAEFNSLWSLVDSIVDTGCKAAGGTIQLPPPQSIIKGRPPPSAVETKCQAKVDIAFLLDGSGSIDFQQPGNFKKCLGFLKNFVQSFNIAKDGTHVGVVLFSKTAEVMFNFEKYLDSKSMVEAIDKIPYPAKSTYTGIGLDLVRTGLFENSARQGVRDILIVMTDGASQDSIEDPSKKLRDMGVTIFCFGVGTQYKKDQLDEMATDPDSKHVLTGGFDDLDQILPKIKKMACDGAGGSLSQIPSKGTGSSRSSAVSGGSSLVGSSVIQGGGSSSVGGSAGSSNLASSSSNSGGGSLISIKDGSSGSNSSGSTSSSAGNNSISGGGSSMSIKGGSSGSSSGGSPSNSGGSNAISSGSSSMSIKGGSSGSSSGGSSSSSGGNKSMSSRSPSISIKRGSSGSSSSGSSSSSGGSNSISDGSSSISIKGGSSSASSGGSSSRVMTIKGGSSSSRSQVISGGKKPVKIGKLVLTPKQGDPVDITDVWGTEDDLVKNDVITGGILGSGVCRDKVDLAFLIDASGNENEKGQRHFKTALTIAKAISSMFVINPLQTHIGFVVFSTNSQVVLNFKTHLDLKSVENAIDSIKYTGGSTNIGAGLKLVKSQLFDLTSRPNVPHILIVLTSGRSTEDVLAPSKALRDSRVNVLCIGIGNRYDKKELEDIATDPDAGHVLPGDVTKLGKTIKEIRGKICRANVRPVALFPLNERYEARDVIGGNLAGVKSYVTTAQGPYKKEGGSLSFLGTPDSFIEFPNNGKLDTKDSLSILAWIYPEKAGPIFNFRRDGWGTNLWLAKPRKLFAHFVHRENHRSIQPLKSTKIAPKRWNFVGATYDQTTGDAGLWINGKFEDLKHIGRIRLATNYPIRMGARVGDKRNYRGRIACVQIYDVALTSEQINNAKNNCKRYKREQ